MSVLIPRTALRQWQDQVAACRAGRLDTEDEAWQRMAEWFPDWVRYNDYVHLVTNRVLPAIRPAGRVLEIGPGSGAFTLALAGVVGEVVALEPSAAMRAVLTRNLTQARITNVRLVPQTIEDGVESLPGTFNLALASHSHYNVQSIDTVIRALVRRSDSVVLLISTGERQEPEAALWQRFWGREPIPPPQLPLLYPLLLELGIYADVEVFWTSHNYVHTSEEALVDWWLRHLQLTEADRPALRAALSPLTEAYDGHIGIYRRSRSALVWIERGRNA